MAKFDKADKNDVTQSNPGHVKGPQTHASHPPSPENVVDTTDTLKDTSVLNGPRPRVLVPNEPNSNLPEGHKAPVPEKNLDPDNDRKMEDNKREAESIVNPTRVKRTHETPMRSAPPSNPVIKAISGRKITLVSGQYKDDEEASVYIAGKAEVILNGEKTTLAALDNGDTVIVGNGGLNEFTKIFEYKSIVATRKK